MAASVINKQNVQQSGDFCVAISFSFCTGELAGITSYEKGGGRASKKGTTRSSDMVLHFVVISVIFEEGREGEARRRLAS